MLAYLRSLSFVADLSLLQLSKKFAMLLALLSGQGKQGLYLLDVRNVTLRDEI